MRRFGIMCLFLGLTAPAIAAEPPASEETPSIPWYRWLFLGERAKPEQPKPEAEKPATAARPRAQATAAAAKEAAVRTMADEQRVYFERLQAITRIRQIAHEKNDEQLLRHCDELEQKAEDNFKMRTAKLPTLDDDRAKLERGRDDGPATAAADTKTTQHSGGRPMKKLIGLAMTAVVLGAVGCSTTNAEKQYAADTPPPLASNSRGDKDIPAVGDPLASKSRSDKGSPTVIDPVRLPRAKTQVSADDIDESNVMDTVRKLEAEMNAEKRASARAGR